MVVDSFVHLPGEGSRVVGNGLRCQEQGVMGGGDGGGGEHKIQNLNET